MRADIFAYMTYSEGLNILTCNAHVLPKAFWDPQVWEYVRQFSPNWCCPAKNIILPKIFGVSTIEEYVMHILLHKVFPGMLQVIISNGMVQPGGRPIPDEVAGQPQKALKHRTIIRGKDAESVSTEAALEASVSTMIVADREI